jgi:hypothetical protein
MKSSFVTTTLTVDTTQVTWFSDILDIFLFKHRKPWTLHNYIHYTRPYLPWPGPWLASDKMLPTN